MRIVPTTEAYMSGFHAALDAVARERRYLGFIESPPLEQTIEFVRALLADGGVQMLAVTDANEVVGWCDIARPRWEGLRHVGRLGMGLLAPYRGQGLGRLLALATIEAAFSDDIERIELDVFSSNVAAIRLYEALGFQQEGVRRRFRKLDGVYDDNIIMALLSPSAA
jgi:RimJ/RimL family protein N-acetyltransferase